MRDHNGPFGPGARRKILFLQGPPSPFWSELGDAFRARGHSVFKVNFCLADWVYWSRRPHSNFRGDQAEWRDYCRAFILEHDITDVLYYADRLPYHVAAAEICRDLGVAAYAVENGYLRPDWITLEPFGMGAYSTFPKDPETIRALAVGRADPDMEVAFRHQFTHEAANEVAFHMLNGLAPRGLWRYNPDRYYHALHDYGAWLWRLLGEAVGGTRRTRTVCDALFHRETPFYLVPLQLQSDYQIRDNSPYQHLREMIEEVIGSFARHAPVKTHLVFKSHPLDNGYERWRRVVARIAAKHGVAKRVSAIDGGPFGTLVSVAKGVVVVNSTSGLHSVRNLKPTIALGSAVYDVPGLTHQRGLDSFWRDPDPVDTRLLRDFLRALAATSQLKGSFYHKVGRAAAHQNIVSRIEDGVLVPADFDPAAWSSRREGVVARPFVEGRAAGKEQAKEPAADPSKDFVEAPALA